METFPGARILGSMSVKVDLDKLAEALADFSFGYLITVGDDFRARAVTQASIPTSPSSARRPNPADTR